MEFLGIDFTHILFFFRILGWSLTVIFIAGFFLSLFGLHSVYEKDTESFLNHFLKHTKEPIISPNRQRWESIREMFSSSNPTSWRMAIIDADSMLEDMIIQLGYPGETFGEKLKQMDRRSVPWLDAAWDVHLLRNKVAHEGSRYILNEREVYRAYKIYENILASEGYLA